MTVGFHATTQNILLTSTIKNVRNCYCMVLFHQRRSAKNHIKILRSLILFVLLFNRTSARTSLTLWIRDVLPNSISLTVLTGYTSTGELPPLSSYYDFMNHFWLAPRNIYSLNSLLTNKKSGKKPQKIGTNSKLAEEDDTSVFNADIVENIMDGIPTSDNLIGSEQYKVIYGKHTA